MREPLTPSVGSVDPTSPSFETSEELVGAMLAGDPKVGLALYDRFADPLFDLAYSCTRDRNDAAMLVANVIVESSTGCPQPKTFNLTNWMYSQMCDQLMSWMGRRLAPDDRVVVLPEGIDITDPLAQGELVWTALAAASERDQMMVNINLRHHLNGEDSAIIMGISQASSELLWTTTTESLRAQLSALLALAWLRYGPTPHPEALLPLLDIHTRWDGNHTPLVHREAVARLQSHPEIGEWVEANIGNPLSLLTRVPLAEAAPELKTQVMERLEVAMQIRASASKPAPDAEDSSESAEIPDGDDTIPPGMWPPMEDLSSKPAPVPRRSPKRKRHHFDLTTGMYLVAGYFLGMVSILGYQQFVDPIAFPDSPGSGTPTPITTVNSPDPMGNGLPGRLTVPTGVLPVEGANTTSMLLANTGGTVLEWQISHAPDWVEAEPSSGTLAPGTTVEVGLTLAKVVDDADQTGHIEISWEGIESGTARVDIESRAGQPPQVGEIQLSATDLICDNPLPLSLQVDDRSGVREVSVMGLTESGKTYNQQLRQQAGGNEWAGVLGPIEEPGTLRLSVTAVDGLGNRVEANRGSVVISC